MKLTPKNWRQFQHYKDRRPPWIKLPHSLLDDKAFAALPGEDAKILVLLWLIASEDHEGCIDADPDEIAFRLRIPREKAEAVVARLMESGWLTVASQGETPASNLLQTSEQPVATCYSTSKVLYPERETETETETEGETETCTEARGRATVVEPPVEPSNQGRARRAPGARRIADRPSTVSESVWSDFVAQRAAKRSPVTNTAVAGIQREADRAGISLEAALRVCLERGWQGFKAEWVRPTASPGRNGFDKIDYREGIKEGGYL